MVQPRARRAELGRRNRPAKAVVTPPVTLYPFCQPRRDGEAVGQLALAWMIRTSRAEWIKRVERWRESKLSAEAFAATALFHLKGM